MPRGKTKYKNWKYTPHKYRKKWPKPTITRHTLKTKAIDSQVEKTMLRIAKQVDVADSWQTSRVEHFKNGETFPSSHARPSLSNMVELQDGIIWFQDITQLPTDSTDNTQETAVGKYQIKTIQSRLRFYSKNMEAEADIAPTCIRVALVKISNGGRKSVLAGGSDINQDIWPNETMLNDTNLRYSGIHKKDLVKTVPGGYNSTVIAQKKFWLGGNKPTNGGKTNGGNSANTTISVVKEIILTKSYTNPLVHFQVVQQTAVDDVLSQAQNKQKIIGDRIWLCILSDAQLNFAFYGVSGCIYNYSELEGLPSVPIPDDNEIIGGQAN